ncbi:MAG: hypothetical protein F4227_01020 [Gammaproteobacteria bacterium]|nr:hypothetical protein [Gammaproteobacteria bacterium]MYF01591.1 hypothetical protein [Gammaproteobacteria bacterium]MYI76226.1 hypothetical protein [Gammaproteobacteria bacterium]
MSEGLSSARYDSNLELFRILNFEIFSFPVPFRRVFRHSSASRQQAENFIVRATVNQQITGWGESCPREYVTGETIATCRQFLKDNLESLYGIENIDSLRSWIDNHEQLIDKNPSAFCAIELALLDAFGKEHSVPIETLLGIDQLRETTNYSAVLGDSPYLVYWLLAQRYRVRGFRNVKIKLSGNLNSDRRKLQMKQTKRLHKRTIRLDANNLWNSVDDCMKYLQLLPNAYWAIEEPLQPKDFTGLTNLAERIEANIILDESVTRTNDLTHYDGDKWVVNLRVSKLGGIHRAIQVAQVAKTRGLNTIVGAHVGETSILTRAGIVLIQYLKNSQLATEGAFGTHLLTEDLATKPLQFARDGQLRLSQTSCLGQPGLGLKVRPDLLKPD